MNRPARAASSSFIPTKIIHKTSARERVCDAKRAVGHPPLRLPLGKVPLVTIQTKLDSVQKDLNDWRS